MLAIDGKTLRRSFDRAAGRSALHVVTAFGSGARVAVAQRAVPDGQNETLAARALLETLALDGLLVTGDAMHAQADTAQVILDRGGDDLFALKANRPAMLREVEAFFADPAEPLAAFETTDADHGRIETRRHRRCCMDVSAMRGFPCCGESDSRLGWQSVSESRPPRSRSADTGSRTGASTTARWLAEERSRCGSTRR